MNAIYETWIVWTLELIQMYLISRLIFAQKRSLSKRRIIIGTLVYAVSLLIMFPCIDFSPVILLLASGIIFVMLLEGTVRHRILVFLCSYCLMNPVFYISIISWALIEGKAFYICIEESYSNILGNVLSILVIVFLGKIVYKIGDWKEIWSNLRLSYYGLMAAVGLFISMYEVSALDYTKKYYGVVLGNLIALCVAIAFVVIYFVILAVFVLNNQRIQYRKESQLKDELIQVSKNYCSELLENENEIRKIRHDMKHHLNAIEILVGQKKYDELEVYLRDSQEPMEHLFYRRVFTRNELLDAILHRYIQREPQIEFCIEGVFVYTKMSDYDLCTLFSNVVTNAIEACEKLTHSEKKIELLIQKKQGNYVIKISNPLETEMNIQGLKTSKENKKEHGYGTKRIEEIVHKYGGTVVFDIMQDSFCVIITFMDVNEQGDS